MSTALAWLTSRKLKEKKMLLSWFIGTPYTGRICGLTVHRLTLPASPSQALSASSFRLTLAVCERKRNRNKQDILKA
jgi:hypothetical protein